MYKCIYGCFESNFQFDNTDDELVQITQDLLEKKYKNSCKKNNLKVFLHNNIEEQKEFYLRQDIFFNKVKSGLRIVLKNNNEENDKTLLSDKISNSMQYLKFGYEKIFDIPKKFTAVKANFTLKLNCETKSPLTCEELFHLNVRPFGEKYETGLVFEWNENPLWPGNVQVTVLPLDKDAKEVACRFTFLIKDENLSQLSNAMFYHKVLSAFVFTLDSVEKFVSDVLGRDKK